MRRPSAPHRPHPSRTVSPERRPTRRIRLSQGAYGGEADFKGRSNGIYNLLSARNVTLNARFVHRKYHTSWSKLWVDGSWLMGTYFTLSTPQSTLYVSFSAHEVGMVAVGCAEGGWVARSVIARCC